MSPEKIDKIGKALNRAGLVSINPPRRFVEDVCPSLWRTNARFKSLKMRPTCQHRTASLARCLYMTAARFDWLADARFDGLTEDQAAELKDIAAELRSVSGVGVCPTYLPPFKSPSL